MKSGKWALEVAIHTLGWKKGQVLLISGREGTNFNNGLEREVSRKLAEWYQ